MLSEHAKQELVLLQVCVLGQNSNSKNKNLARILKSIFAQFCPRKLANTRNLKIEIKNFPYRFFAQTKLIRGWLVIPVNIK